LEGFHEGNISTFSEEMAASVNAEMQKRDVGKDQGNIPQANDFKSVVQITNAAILLMADF
jgi:hypothetical protein